MSEDLVLERRDAVAIVWFNRPDALNAFTPEMSLELQDLLRRLRDDDAVRVIVLTGKGRAFSAGADLKALSRPGRLGRPAEVGYERVRAAGLRMEELFDLPKATVAAVNGAVAGFSLSLVFACDVVFAAEGARFAINFGAIGYVPDAGVSFFLPRLVGLHRAKELFFAGRTIGAVEAERIGLVNRIVPDASLLEETVAFAHAVAERPPAAIRMGKQLLNRAVTSDFRTVVELEAYAQGILGTTRDHQEAVRAFGAKRKP